MRHFVALAFVVLTSATANAVVLRPSDILVLGTSGVGSGVIRVDPATGAQTLVSAGSVYPVKGQGWSPININDFTVDEERRLFAIVGDTVVQIDPATGTQSVVIPTGSLIHPVAIAVGQDGGLFVLDQAALGGIGAIFRFDPVTHGQSTASAGGVLLRGSDMEIAPGGDPVVVWNCCITAVTLEFGPVNPPVRIDALTGEQAFILGGTYYNLTGLGMGLDAGSGQIVSNGTLNATYVYRINAETGEVVTIGHTSVSDPSSPFPTLRELIFTDAAIDQSGRLLLTGLAFDYFGPPSPPAGLYDATIYDPFSVGHFIELQVVPGIPQCDDGIDNDGDALTDYPADPGCAARSSVTENPACDDGVDNDGDGKKDYPLDGGCSRSSDVSEQPDCQDGIDNDGDGLADYPADMGCAIPEASIENPECNDGIDNDGDALVDRADPQCSEIAANPRERSGCGLGPELGLLLPPLLFWRTKRPRVKS